MRWTSSRYWAIKKKTSTESAAAIGADRRGTNRLLKALCALKLLTKSADKYANAPVAEKYLVKGRPDNQFSLIL